MWPFSKKARKFKPSKADRQLMESTTARLQMLAATVQPYGTIIRSIPGVVVKFLPLAGRSVATVYEEGTERPIGSITHDGKIVYMQPHST